VTAVGQHASVERAILSWTQGRDQARKGIAMTRLRQRMIEDMRLRGLSARTQDAYARSVRQLAEHYGRSPDLISEEEFRRYFLHLVEVKRFARASLTIALCGIKFFFEHTVQRDWTVCDVVRPPRQRQLPVVLSRDEVRAILHCVRIDLYRVCLTTIYACGLRLREGTELPIHQVDSALMQLHIVGKAYGVISTDSTLETKSHGALPVLVAAESFAMYAK
jgi:site-specific recombinase XerD